MNVLDEVFQGRFKLSIAENTKVNEDYNSWKGIAPLRFEVIVYGHLDGEVIHCWYGSFTAEASGYRWQMDLDYEYPDQSFRNLAVHFGHQSCFALTVLADEEEFAQTVFNEICALAKTQAEAFAKKVGLF